ncbi:MAG: nucleotidyl transferase AbiEii/AbiGii toxin family protein [Candidatus Micrarchaeaceae archaeon]
MEPIGSFLKGERLEVALLQDKIIEIVYSSIEPDALLYGGTAVWRCYGGMRFSEDIDIYMRNESIEHIIKSLPRHGLSLAWRSKELPSNIRISNGRTSVLLEAKEGSAEGIITQYARVDGSAMTVRAMSPAELLARKIEAYSGRLLMRDLYDIFVLTNSLDKNDYAVRSLLIDFIKHIKKPADEQVLKTLVYSGKSITFGEFVAYMKRWLNEV